MLPESRFVELPLQAAQAERSVTHPAGFKAAGIHAGLKRSGRRDLGVLYAERAGASAAVFTTNAAAAAPVRLTRDSSRCEHLRAVVVNSGNANACTGKQGLGDAARMRRVAADSLGLRPEEVAVCSTGIIGVPLPIDAVCDGIVRAAPHLGHAQGGDFAAAIRTTDRLPKEGALTLGLAAGEVRLGFACKGAGMISPDMATMLCFVTTDAVVPAATLQAVLGRAVDATFNRVTVDGQQSTNDTVLAFAGGASGVEPAGADLELFADALRSAFLRLALALVADGEGATKTMRLRVDGAGDAGEAERVARAVANSPLLKAAMYGGDPNWGRVMQAAGQIIGTSNGCGLKADIAVGDVVVAGRGEARPLSDGAARALRRLMAAPEIDLALTLYRGIATATIYFSDLTHEYVSENSDHAS